MIEAASRSLFFHPKLKYTTESNQEKMSCYKVTFERAQKSLTQELADAMQKHNPFDDRRKSIGLSSESKED